MRHRLLLATLSLLLGSSLTGTAQTTVAGFDPRPVTIPVVRPEAPRPVTLGDLIHLRDFKGMSVSPDGKFVAYVVTQAVLETNSYRSALFVVATDKTGVPKNLGSAGPARWDTYGQLDVAPQWSPDSKFISYLLKENATWRIWTWRREGGPAQQLTHNTNDVQDYRWSPDGARIYFNTSEPPNTEEAKRKAADGIVWDGSIQASRGRTVMQWVLDTVPGKTQLWVYDVAARSERKASADDQAAYKKLQERPKDISATRTFKISRSGDIAYISVVQDAKQFPYYAWVIYLKRKNEQPVGLTPLSTNYVQDIWWSNDEREIYFIQRAGVRASLFAVSATGGTPREITSGDDQFHSCSFDNDRLVAACIRENPVKPPELAVINPRDGGIRTLAQINPEFQNITLSPATKLEWTNKYSEKGYAYLIKPLNYQPGKRYPLIVTTYRTGSFLRGATGDEYPIQVFAANGFVVLDFDGPPQHVDGDFKTNMLRWYSPLASFEQVFDMLDKMGLVDPSRRGLTGLSYGADITEFAISHSSLFHAAATSGASGRDPLFYYLSGNAGSRLFTTLLGGSPDGPAAENWKELSPALNAGKVNAALLINAPDREYIGGLQFYTALKEQHKPVEMIVYPEEGHIKSQPKHRYAIYQRNVDWFNFWLQDKEDSDPRKKDQYARWRSLKEQTTSRN
jgi:dipeptidyl aminopeptidase/acylaminoacyl peptidase